jgi:5' nucleotidase, deoxy (Pyrimidine), cytosolic type C protein (NT5C)
MMKYGMIYTDYDGVVANFVKGVEAKLGRSITGKDWEDMDQGPRNKLYSQACDSVDFWSNLETMPDYSTYWGYIKYWSPGVITAYPMWNKDAVSHAIKGKTAWNKKHTMVPDSRFHVCARSDKKNWALNNGKPNILIDDHEKNIHEWDAAGGVGILHTSAVSTIIQLKRLGFTK